MVHEAMKASVLLEEKGVSARVVDMYTVKPLDIDMVIRCAQETGSIITAENHNIIGGLGDAVGACLLENGLSTPMKKIGVKDRFGSVGPQDYLQKHYGLTAVEIVNAAL
jgi:transketolase